MVGEGRQTSIEDIEDEIVTGIEAEVEIVIEVGTVAVGVEIEVVLAPMEQHSCYRTPSLDFQDKAEKDRDFLVPWGQQAPDVCCH